MSIASGARLRPLGLVAVLALAFGTTACDGAVSTPSHGADAGLIAYSLGGDIFIGDTETGESRALTSGPEIDVNPMFSPDGTWIAFSRRDERTTSRLVVIRPDGSDERVVLADGSGPGLGVGPFAWTPDAKWLVVEQDLGGTPYMDGILTLVSLSGDPEPERITPPLSQSIGAIAFNPSAQIAPMFQPPHGNLILDGSLTEPRVFDADLRSSTPLAPEVISGFAGSEIYAATWSPDGGRIVLELRGADPALLVIAYPDGSAIRLEPGFNAQWSPDGTQIAFEPFLPDEEPGEVSLHVVHLATGEVRALSSTTSPVKRGATVQTITNNIEHTWFFEGWRWSPDGRNLLVLKDHNTRPLVVDVATDTAHELPWETDSFPSWQPMPAY